VHRVSTSRKDRTEAIQGRPSGCSGRGDFHDLPRIGQVQTFLAEKRQQRLKNTLPDVSKGARTMTDLWEHVAKTYRGKPSTFASYEHRWRNHVQPALGRRRLDSLLRSDIEALYADVEARTSLDTRRKVQQIVHKMLAVAVGRNGS
jgi:hypothetical protein